MTTDTVCDFNQGLDCRMLTIYHAERIARIKRPMVRLALDSICQRPFWTSAFECLRRAGITKSRIRSYALIAEKTGSEEAWERCNWIESHGVKALPMWFHPLDSLTQNAITPSQKKLGWNRYEQKRIMRWFYKHTEEPKPLSYEDRP